jgi:peptide chain release factor 3
MARFNVCRWISAADKAELERFINAKRGDIARDLDGDPVFLASDGFSLNYEAERWKAITFDEVKEYQIGIAA